MNDFEKQVVEELKKIRRDVSDIEQWMMPLFVFAVMIWLHGCK